MRHRAREAALKMLFALSFDEKNLSQVFEQFVRHFSLKKFDIDFAKNLTFGVKENEGSLDETICKYLVGWKLERIPMVDRIILRMSLFERDRDPELSKAIIIDEAIELAKKYGGHDSPRFLNGVLDNAFKEKNES
jgi:transcription antitermination protein NusB